MIRKALSGPAQPHIPGLARADKVAQHPKISESALQQQTRQTLANLGYASAEVGATRKQVTCPCCAHRFFPDGWQGNSVGWPDLQVFRFTPSFPPVAFPIELKTQTGKPSKTQQDLADRGRSQITHSIRETVEAIINAERLITDYHAAPEQIERLERFLKENQGRI